MLTLYFRHPGRLLLNLRQLGRLVFHQAAKVCILAFDRLGVPFNGFALFRVPTRVAEVPSRSSSIPLAPMTAWPEQSARNARRGCRPRP